MSRPTLAIISPVYREEAVIATFHEALVTVLQGLEERREWRVLYVLDRSPDRTERILQEISEADPRVSTLVMSRRFGHQAALVAGLDHVDADAVIMLDCDLQHPPELIPRMLDAHEQGADIVQMVRRDPPSTGFLKRSSSGLFYRVMGRLAEIDLPAGAADFRLVGRSVVEVFQRQLREHNQFVRGLVNWVGFDQVTIEYDAADRAAGRTKYSLGRLVNFAFSGVFAFSKAPLRYCIAVGVGIAIFSLLYALAVVIMKLAGVTVVPGWTSLLALQGLVSGIQLVFLGVIGEYIGQMYDEVKNRPIYVVQRVHGATPVVQRAERAPTVHVRAGSAQPGERAGAT